MGAIILTVPDTGETTSPSLGITATPSPTTLPEKIGSSKSDKAMTFPFIGAITYYKGVVLRINSAYVIEKQHNLKAGEICDINNSLKVACGKDILEIDSIQFGPYFISSGRDFVDRVNVKTGEILSNE